LDSSLPFTSLLERIDKITLLDEQREICTYKTLSGKFGCAQAFR
jgi:hypothetical protein